MQVQCKLFKSSMKSWEKLCAEAAAFATKIGPERLINISVAGDTGNGVVCVWYWE